MAKVRGGDARFYVSKEGDYYIIERYRLGGRESDGPFATRELAQARADILNAEADRTTRQK